MSILLVVVAAVLVFLYSLVIMSGGFATTPNYIDLPSLILIVLWTLPVLIGAGLLKDFGASFRRAFSTKLLCTREELARSMEAVQLAQKANWIAGLLGFLIAFVYICKSYGEMGAEVFLLNVSVAVIVIIYAAMLNLILLAVYGRLKKRYMDYMQGE